MNNNLNFKIHMFIEHHFCNMSYFQGFLKFSSAFSIEFFIVTCYHWILPPCELLDEHDFVMVEVARPCFWCSAVHSLSRHLHFVASPSLLFHWLVRSKHEGGKARRSLIIVLYRMSTFIVAIVGTFQCRRWVLLDIGLVSLLLPKVVLLNSPSLPRCFVTYLLFYFHSTHYRGENISEF
jgi:hypothetical protein